MNATLFNATTPEALVADHPVPVAILFLSAVFSVRRLFAPAPPKPGTKHKVTAPKYKVSPPPLKILWDEFSRPAFILATSTVVMMVWPHAFLTLLIGALVLLYFSMRAGLKDMPRLSYTATDTDALDRMRALTARCPSLHRAYRPTLWAFHTRVQSAMFALWQFPLWLYRGSAEWERELVECDDGGQVALDWIVRVNGKPVAKPVAGDDGAADLQRPILLIAPGIIGNRKDKYIKRLVLYVARKAPQWRVVVKSWRGLGIDLKTPKPETWGPQCVEDLCSCVQQIRSRYPDAPLVGAGFSYGGQSLLCHMGLKQGPKAGKGGARVTAAPPGLRGLDAAVCISGLFDMGQVARNMSGTIYDYINMSEMYNKGVYKAMPLIQQHIGEADPDIARITNTNKFGLMDFHERVTSQFLDPPAKDVDETLGVLQGCAVEAAGNIAEPLLCLHADDDDVTPLKTCKEITAASAGSPGMVVARTKRGGHCGWFEGARGKSWLVRVVFEFLSANVADIQAKLPEKKGRATARRQSHGKSEDDR